MFNNLKTKIIGIILSFLMPFAFADNLTSTNKATASLASSCSVSVDSASFNFIPQASGNYDSTTLAHMKCTRGTVVNLQINNFVRSTCGRRELGLNGTIAGANYLLYNIYTTNTYSTIYTNTGYACEGSGAMPNLTATGLTQDIPLYIRVPANQYVVPGVYWDNVTMMFVY